MKALINSFNAGEVTPLVVGRVDLESLRRACRVLKNFIPRVFGGAFRRPSMMHVAMANDATKHARVIAFSTSATKKFMVELGHQCLRVFNADTGETVFGPIVSPWAEAQVDAVQLVQVNDVMWLTHQDVPGQELRRIADNNWVLTPVPWTEGNASPPMRDVNVSATTLQCMAATGSGVLMVASADTFLPEHVGSYWQVGHMRDILSSELEFAPIPRANRSSEHQGIGAGADTWRVITSSAEPAQWSGTLFVEKFNPDDNAYDVEEQREVLMGDHLNFTGPSAGGSYRVRIKDATVMVTTTFRIEVNGNPFLFKEFTVTAPSPANATGDELVVNGRWDFTTYGRWSGEIFLEEKNAAGTWDVVRRWTGELDRNISATGMVDGERTLRLRGASVISMPASDAAKARWVLEATDALIYGLVKVVSYTGPKQVMVDILRPLYANTATTNWREGAFSAVRGYPRAVALHEQRLVFAGTRSQPQTIWGSTIADFRNFNETGLDDGAFSYQVAAQESNPIVWMASQDGLIVGTEGDEWLMTGGTDKPITPSNITTRRKSGEGSAAIQAQLAGSTVLFVDQSTFHVREYVFEWETQNYVAPYVTQLFNHRTLSGIRAFAVAKTPDKTIWAVTNDGKLLSCAYRREEQVIAWAPHETAGEVESVAAVYGLPGGGTEVWLVVKRNGTRRIERFRPGYWRDLERGEQMWHLDAAVVKKGAFAEVDGLEHLEGQEVGIVADGAERPRARVIGGAVSVPSGTAHAVVGLPFESVLQPMPFEMPLQDGTAQGRRFKVSELAALLYKTQAGQYADSPNGPWYDLVIRGAEDDANSAPPAFTGLKKLSMNAEFRDGVDVTIRTDSAMPLNVLSLVPTLQVYGS